jgi:hypothetical protein
MGGPWSPSHRELNCVNGNRPAYLAIVDEAKKQGLPFVGHVPEFVSAAEHPTSGRKAWRLPTGPSYLPLVFFLNSIPRALTHKAAHIRFRLGIIIPAGNPSAINLFLEKAEFEASVEPRATTHPSQPVTERRKAITVSQMLPAIGALLPSTTKLMPLAWCHSALRTIHGLLLPLPLAWGTLIINLAFQILSENQFEWTRRSTNPNDEDGAGRRFHLEHGDVWRKWNSCFWFLPPIHRLAKSQGDSMVEAGEYARSSVTFA